MRKVLKKTAYFLFIATVILLTVVFSSYSYGWLINYVKQDFGFTTFEYDKFKLEIAKITATTTQTPAPAENTYPEANRTYTPVANNKIEANADGTHLGVTLENMSFGSIDNVAQLKNENIVYLRLTVPKTLGGTINLSLHYSDDNFIQLYKNTYDADGNTTGTQEVTGETVNNLLAVENAENANDSFLLYKAIVSNEAYKATAIADNLESQFDEANYRKFIKKSVFDAESATDPYANKITLINENYDALTGNDYYVYIKIVPNLSVFAYSIEYISDIMPCFTFFKTQATFEAPNAST